MFTKLSGDYISNRAWFKDVIGTDREDMILCHTSALECLQLFSGYMNEKNIDVYAKKKGIYENVNYRIINDFNDVDKIQVGDLLCTSVNQTINDMLNDFDNTDEQALIQALSKYYHTNNNSFDGLIIKPENIDFFNHIKDWASEYYNERRVANDGAGKIHVSNIR